MWCTPWLSIFRIGLPRSPSRSVANPDSDRELCSHDGLVCGVGPVEGAAATARTLALHRFDVVLHVGLAGGRDLAIGSVVVGSEAVYTDLSAEWPVVTRVTPDAGLFGAVHADPHLGRGGRLE